MRIHEYVEDASLLIKGDNETVENEVKEQKGGFLSMLAATLDVSLLGNMLADNQGQGVIRDGAGKNRAGQDF